MAKNMLIRNAMNKTFQQSWMPHTTTEQPGVDSDHGRKRSEDRKNKYRNNTEIRNDFK